MKRKISILALVLVAVAAFFILTEHRKRIMGEAGLVKVISFNLKNRDPEVPWEDRAEMLKYFVDTYEPDVFGMQEVTMGSEEWIRYLPRAFSSKKYDFVGEARSEDPKLGLEAVLIYYRKDKYDLLDSGTFWLSESGIKGQIGWDGAYPRICTYALLRQKNTDDTFLCMNTHLDNKGEEARRKGFAMIIEKAKELGMGQYPLILTGDMNTRENDKAGIYQSFVSTEGIGDVKFLAEQTESGVTYRTSKHGDPIDFIFVSTANTHPLLYKRLTEDFDGRYLSDHYGLYAEIRIAE